MGIEVLIRHYRDPALYDWVVLESEDTDIKALDDVVAMRCDKSVEYYQVKFTVGADRYPLDWAWLLDAKPGSTSLLTKWCRSFHRAVGKNAVHRAQLRTNRLADAAFAQALVGLRIDLSRVDDELRARIDSACGGSKRAAAFFSVFEFAAGELDLDAYADRLRNALVPTDTDDNGWRLLREQVERWSTRKGEPEPDGHILRSHVIRIISERRPTALRQDFKVPAGYVPPNTAFHESVKKRALRTAPITIVWGTPGRGKSTYLSFLTGDLEAEAAIVLRHHYFLATDQASSKRASFSDIAASLLDQLALRRPRLVSGSESARDLREVLASAAEALEAEGRRLLIIVDGLDHVWRDTSRMDQLDQLFDTLLPLTPNTGLVVGTQRVADAQLPTRLLTTAAPDDWLEIPAMDGAAVHHWLQHQNTVRQLVAVRGTDEPPLALATVADALHRVSGGHPLHLIYTVESLVRRGAPIDAEAVEALPACPNGDIRAYYLALWNRIGNGDRRILHALAGTGFFWPGDGLRTCLGDYDDIAFLLEPRRLGLVPFHASLFAWIRERPDHAERFAALRPAIIVWLEGAAPRYWQWGWAWLMRAESGDPAPLLTGATRDWAVTSLAEGWPDEQIEAILGAAERITFDQLDLPATIRLRSLKTRVDNALEFQIEKRTLFVGGAIAINGNLQQVRNVADTAGEQPAELLVALARWAPASVRADIANVALEELARRINLWIALRHRSSNEFHELTNVLIEAAAIVGQAAIERIVRFIHGFREPAPYLLIYAKALARMSDATTLDALRGKLRGKLRSRLLPDVMTLRLQAALQQGMPPSSALDARYTHCAYGTAVATLFGLSLPPAPPALTPPPQLADNYFPLNAEPDMRRFFGDLFWTGVATAATNGNIAALVPPSIARDAGWLATGSHALLTAAAAIVSDRDFRFAAVFEALGDCAPVAFVGHSERNYRLYQAFRSSLRDIALDLHRLSGARRISASDLTAARASVHWIDEAFVSETVAAAIPVLDKPAAAALEADMVRALAARITPFNERADQWTEIAMFGHLHDSGQPGKALRRAADCLMGYGWRKDLWSMDVLDAIAEVHALDEAASLGRLQRVAPIIDAITEFTDGDETDHVRSDLIELVAKTFPPRLAALYESHLKAAEYRYADEALAETIRCLPFDLPEAQALTRTLVDASSLSLLSDRCDDPAALEAYRRQMDFLGGRPIRDQQRDELGGDDAKPEKKTRPPKVDPKRYGPKGLTKLIKAADIVPYDQRSDLLKAWLEHAHTQGKGLQALRSIDAYLTAHESASDVEKLLDTAYEVSRAVEGHEAAYAWLVRAHTLRRGWSSYWVSDEEVMRRLREVAARYSDRWETFIRDSGVQPTFWRRRGYGFAIGQRYLVRFLMLVGEGDLAGRVTDAMINLLVSELSDQPLVASRWTE